MSDFKDKWAPWIGLLAILGFGALVILLLQGVGQQEPQWSRMVFIFGAVETAGLAALGFFFGKEVNRARAEKAEVNAAEAAQAAVIAERGQATATTQFAALVKYIETQSPTTALGPPAILDEIDRILDQSGQRAQSLDLAAYVAAARLAASQSEPDTQWTALRRFARSLQD